MEASRIVSALTLVEDDFTTGGVKAEFEAVVSNVDKAAKSPTEAPAQDAFTEALERLSMALQAATTNRAPLSIVNALHQINAGELIGESIQVRLDAILQVTPFLLPQASAALAALRNDVNALYTKAMTALAGLRGIGIVPAPVESDEYEAGILMPSSFTSDNLRSIKDHLHAWIRHIDTIEELVNGQTRDVVPVRSVSSSSFDLFISLDAEGALALLILAKGCALIMKSVRDAAGRRAELEGEGYPDSVLEGMKKHEETLVETGKEQIVQKVIERKHETINKGRLNELKRAIESAMDYVLRSMNRGVDVEVSVPPAGKEGEEEVEAGLVELQKEIARLNRDVAAAVKGLPDRTEPLLALPEPLNDGFPSPNGDGEAPPPTPVEVKPPRKRTRKPQ